MGYITGGLLIALALFILWTPLALAPTQPAKPVIVPGVIATRPAGGLQPTLIPVPTVDPTDRFAGLLAIAQSWIGTPYLWGGCSKAGVDCSCFVRNVLATAGINAPRVTWQQIQWTRPVSREQMQPFDLVYFNDTCTDCGPNPTHVGLYIGNGMMIQAGGSAVSLQPVFSGFYGQHFASAGRVPV